MTLRGTSFLAIWNDIDQIEDVAYDAWLTHEHMPERMGVPGFLRGRRYVALDGAPPHRYFNFYEISDADVMTGAAYLHCLNHPTPQTQRVMPHLTNFQRMGGRTIASHGRNVGGVLATLRFQAPLAQVEAAAQALCEGLLHDTVVVGCHVGVPLASVAAVQTRERELRAQGAVGQEAADDHVLLIESANGQALQERLSGIGQALGRHIGGASSVHARLYGLSYLLEAQAA